MKEQPILVSACLAGVRCRYDGGTNTLDAVVQLVREGRAIPYCPEVYGGLTTPRAPCEKRDDRVVDCNGEDCTEQFTRGAEDGLRIAQLAGCAEAILKANSPSCGFGTIYDGTFSSTLIPGNGIFAAMLAAHGIVVRNEKDPDLA